MTISRTARLRTLLVAMAVGFALLAGEVASRVLSGAGPPGVAFHRCDRELGWRGIPNDQFDLQFPDGDVRIVRNSRGMHDGEHEVGLSPSRSRVLYLGDSFVESLQVAERDSHHQLLEDAFAGRLEVVNAGIGGWSLGQELLYFENEGSSYRPGLVLLFWYVGNDLWDVLPTARYQTCSGENCYSPYFVLRGSTLEKWSGALGAPIGWPDRHRFGRRFAGSALHALQSISSLGRRLSAFLPMRDGPPLFSPEAPWRDAPDSALEEAWRVTDALLSRLKRDVEEAGGRLAVVVVPFKPAVEADHAQTQWTQAPGGPLLLPGDTRRPNERMRELAARLELPVLDLHAAFLDNLEHRGPEAFWPDSHWTRAGNRLAAAAVATWVKEAELIAR